MVFTRNGSASGGGASHEQSQLSAELTHSIVRSPGGGSSVFFNNNASLSHVELRVRQNVLGGQFGGNAASSRPDPVFGSSASVQSNGNLCRPDVPVTATLLGWNLQGGSDQAMAGTTPGETLNNHLWVHSVDDRIEGWGRGIIAAGGQRNSAVSAPVSSNTLDLILQGTHITSITADLLFRGGNSLVAGMSPGNFNELRVTMRNVTGSGSRTNSYINSTANPGIGNRLSIVGSLNAFSRTNQNIVPAPDAQFFTAGR
jgi:hypothetical protein